MMRHRHCHRGFSLIELVIFIVVTSILATALFAVFSTALRGPALASDSNRAMQIAVERMELILPQRQVLGFAAFAIPAADPCQQGSAQLACTSIPAGFTVTPAIAPDWGGDTNYKVVTITVTGPATATLTSLIADY